MGWSSVTEDRPSWWSTMAESLLCKPTGRTNWLLQDLAPARAFGSLAYLGYLDVFWEFSTSLSSSSNAEKGKSIHQC